MVVEKAYAKVNLTLNVKEEINGYHMIESLMVPIDLYDVLIFEKNNSDKMILVDNFIENNIILKAADMFMKKYNTSGATITLEKNIPMEAGLAGGSADATATLRGLNKLFELNLSLDELNELAKELGSDTSFTLYNHAALCKGRGEILEFIEFDGDYDILLLKPKYGISTKEAYSNLKEISNKTSEDICTAIKKNAEITPFFTNDLLKSALLLNSNLKSDIELIKKYTNKYNMSGSGSTLYIIDNICELKKLEKIFKDKFYFVKLCKISSSY